MKCSECGNDFEPDCDQEEVCKPCQYADVLDAVNEAARLSLDATE